MKKIRVQTTSCMGCHLCEVYCKVEHSQSKDLIKAFKQESPEPMTRISIELNKPVSFPLQCRHCDEPACVYACLTGALSKNPTTGVVMVDMNKCVGCWTCVLACPFGAIKQDQARHRIAKCDLCDGKEVPACVANCPNETLSYV